MVLSKVTKFEESQNSAYERQVRKDNMYITGGHTGKQGHDSLASGFKVW